MYAYSGKTDLTLTFLLFPISFGAWAMNALEPGTVLALRVLFYAMISESAVEAWRANRSAWKALFAFPAKYILAATLLICGVFALGAVKDSFARNSNESRLARVALAGVGIYLFMGTLHWIKKLTRPGTPRTPRSIAAASSTRV